MIGMGRYRLLAISSLASGIANLALSIVLGKMFGLTGVALGTLIPTVIESLFFIIPYTVRLLKIPLREVFRHVVVPSLVPAVPALLSLYLLEQAIGAQSLIEVVFIATISGIVYASGYLVIGASEIERSAYRNFARNTWRFAGARLKRA
jgi:O-antigen/teichoic acid export membrane protein